MRKGMVGLAMLVQPGLAEDPFSGAIYAFRGRRAGLSSANAPAAPKDEVTELLARYRPMRNFPMLNRTAVAIAPAVTSRQASEVSGSTS